MRLEEYTPDSICRAMDLSGFIEEPWTHSEIPALRVILMPSFHPELCITLSPGAGSELLSVAALAEKLWGQRGEVCIPCHREGITLASGVMDELVGLFQAAHAALDPDRRSIFIDGMGSESCLVSRAGTLRIEAHACEKAISGFIARLIDLAWTGCQLPQVRNALAEAGRYLELTYPMQNVSPKPPGTLLAVLGTPDERHAYLEMFRRHKKDKG